MGAVTLGKGEKYMTSPPLTVIGWESFALKYEKFWERGKKMLE